MTGPNVRVTRIRSDIAHAAMTADFVLQASADQSELSNVRNVTQSVNLTCPIYNGCNVVGTGTLAQAQASVDGGTSSGASSSSSSGAGFAPGSGPAATGSNSGGSSGGCTAARQGNTAPGVAFGSLAGLLGLFVGRAIRVRRRRSQSKR